MNPVTVPTGGVKLIVIDELVILANDKLVGGRGTIPVVMVDVGVDTFDVP
jgi:hypothetical protein